MPISGTRRKGASAWPVHRGAVFWTLLVCLALLVPGDARPLQGAFPWTLPEGSDKIGHGVLFFIETRFLLRSFRHLRPGLPPLAAAVLAAVVLGVLTETAQLWVPYRTGSGSDLLADALGACAYAAWHHARRARTESI